MGKFSIFGLYESRNPLHEHGKCGFLRAVQDHQLNIKKPLASDLIEVAAAVPSRRSGGSVGCGGITLNFKVRHHPIMKQSLWAASS